MGYTELDHHQLEDAAVVYMRFPFNTDAEPSLSALHQTSFSLLAIATHARITCDEVPARMQWVSVIKREGGQKGEATSTHF